MTPPACPGVGGMLKTEEAVHSWTCYVWNFSQHRLADIVVHLGHALSSPLRIDHWLCLAVHCVKYSGRPIPLALKTRVGFRSGKMALDDWIDVGLSENVQSAWRARLVRRYDD